MNRHSHDHDYKGGTLKRLGWSLGITTVVMLVELVADLTEATPRDTGWAANNWIPQVGAQQEAFPVEETGPPTPVDLASVLTASPQQLAAEGGIVGNGVPYITYLNEGSSAKAPAASVQAAMEKSLASVNARRRPPGAKK